MVTNIFVEKDFATYRSMKRYPWKLKIIGIDRKPKTELHYKGLSGTLKGAVPTYEKSRFKFLNFDN